MSRRLSIALPLILLAGCIPSPKPMPQPAPPPAPTPAPAPTPTLPPPPPASSDWRDWPVTPGDWRYSGSVARFGADIVTLACDRGSRNITVTVQGTGQRMTLRTSSTARTIAVQPGRPGTVSATLPGRDNLFDALGFSRGRFVIEGVGARPLVIPAWPEILRVAEDCRP
jgi:hypothetical protein